MSEIIPCPNCKSKLQRITQDEFEKIIDYLEKISFTRDDDSYIVICHNCGYFELLLVYPEYKEDYENVRKILLGLEPA